MSTKEEILAFLNKNDIPYKLYEHEPCDTVEEKKALDIRLGISARHCKNIFLTTRTKDKLFLLVMPFEKTFRTAEVSKELGTSRLSFATEEMLNEKLHCRSGTLSSLCLIYDTDGEIGFALDEELKNESALCFHPADDTVTLAIDTDVCFTRLFPALKKTPISVTVTCPNA